jgi:uncharacterized protein YjbI with pentapeptide repeats
MANKGHLKILKQGMEVWNHWREENPDVRPDLSGAHLNGANLSGADLSGADLTRVRLIMARLGQADLSKADLSGADLSGADLTEVDLIEADLRWADLRKADLSGADLSGADLSEANLSRAKIANGNLRGVTLNGTVLFGADLTNADLSEAKVGLTVFANNDLSTVKGLESVHHFEFSSVSIDTIYRSRGNIPEAFLRGAGVPDTFISYISALTGKATQYYSCFLSYSSKDNAFAERLYADLQAVGIRCWFAPEDMGAGTKIRQTIDQSIRLHDKLLLVLSKNTVTSEWVRREVEVALKRERETGRTVLFPIRLDDTVMGAEEPWILDIRHTRHIGDFSLWEDRDYYQKALSRLVRDLAVSVAAETDKQERAQ